MIAPRRARLLRRLLLAAVAALFAASIPWYRSEDSAVGLLLGMPDWVAISLGCYALAAVFNAAAWLLTQIDDGPPPAEGP